MDKIIIAQESLGRLMNVLCPGVYVSMTKIDFKALDSVGSYPDSSRRIYLSSELATEKDQDLRGLRQQICYR